MTNLSTYFKQAPLYDPPMMQFDGATNYYLKTGLNFAGNADTFVLRFRALPKAAAQRLAYCFKLGSGRTRAAITLLSSADGTSPNCIRLYVQNTAGTNIINITTANQYADNELHTVVVGYDATVGQANMIVDGVSDIDTGHPNYIISTGTIDSGASCEVSFGAMPDGTLKLTGEIGYAGHKEAYLTNWQDFMDAQGNPKPLDEFGWTQWGGGTFAPATQLFNGSTGYFTKTTGITTSGNLMTCVLRFKRAAFTGDRYEALVRFEDNLAKPRINIYCCSSDWTADADQRSRIGITVQNTAGTNIFASLTNDQIIDGNWHTLMICFNGDTGAGFLYVDGAASELLSWAGRVAPTTGTLGTGTPKIFFGVSNALANHFGGEMNFFGVGDVYLTTVGDFMDATGVPQEIDELNWTEWGGQPLFWNKYGAMDDNKGSAGNLTRNGTVTHTPNSQPLFWHEAAKMDEQLGSAGVMTENGTILLGKGGN